MWTAPPRAVARLPETDAGQDVRGLIRRAMQDCDPLRGTGLRNTSPHKAAPSRKGACFALPVDAAPLCLFL